MRIENFVVVALSALIGVSAVAAKSERSAASVAEFKRQYPCPANGARRGACPGYVVDHVKPLCADGPDCPENMQWQTVADGKTKDRWESALCQRKQPRH